MRFSTAPKLARRLAGMLLLKWTRIVTDASWASARLVPCSPEDASRRDGRQERHISVPDYPKRVPGLWTVFALGDPGDLATAPRLGVMRWGSEQAGIVAGGIG